MHTISSYSLRQARGPNRELLRDTLPLGIVLKGSCIEAQFELESGDVLLWLSDDSPYDEGLHIYLLGGGVRILDVIEAGADFAAGLLRIHASGAKWVRFEFFTNDVEYRLDVFDRPVFRRRLPSGWRYGKWRWRHRLVVTEVDAGGTQ